jgi:hypothetical protein
LIKGGPEFERFSGTALLSICLKLAELGTLSEISAALPNQSQKYLHFSFEIICSVALTKEKILFISF